jgi:hypothetical protein
MQLLLLENIKALFLLYLAISSNFLSNTMNCSINKVLKENMFLKHIFLIALIYFTIDFTSKDLQSPFNSFKQSMYIYILFLLLSKQQFIFFIINFSLIFVIYIMSIQDQYNKQNNVQSDHNLLDYIRHLKQILIITLIIGYVIYFKQQYTDYKGNFNLIYYIFGTISCKKMT